MQGINMVVVYCGQHPEYKPKAKPQQHCKTCELFFVLVGKDSQFIKGVPDPHIFVSQLTKKELEDAILGLETSVSGWL